MIGTLTRLAFSGIRSRVLASMLTVLLATAAAATVVLALEVGQSGRDPWQRTFAAANGGHVLADVPTRAQAQSLHSLEGVKEADAPVPHALVGIVTENGTERLLLSGPSGPAHVEGLSRPQGSRLDDLSNPSRAEATYGSL